MLSLKFRFFETSYNLTVRQFYCSQFSHYTTIYVQYYITTCYTTENLYLEVGLLEDLTTNRILLKRKERPVLYYDL